MVDLAPEQEDDPHPQSGSGSPDDVRPTEPDTFLAVLGLPHPLRRPPEDPRHEARRKRVWAELLDESGTD